LIRVTSDIQVFNRAVTKFSGVERKIRRKEKLELTERTIMPISPRWMAQLGSNPNSAATIIESIARGLIIEFPSFADPRGEISVIDEKHLPFKVARLFFVYGSTRKSIRGDHAHVLCDQLLVSTAGWTNVYVERPDRTFFSVRLDEASLGLLIPAGHWACQYERSNEAVLTVAASRKYEIGDYIRCYEDWESSIQK